MSLIMMGELRPIPWNVVRQDSGQALVVGPEHYEFFSKVKPGRDDGCVQGERMQRHEDG